MSVIEKLLAYQEEDKKLFALERKLKDCEARKNGVKAQKFLVTVSETLAGIEAKAFELCTLYDNLCEELEKIKENNAEFDSIADSVTEDKEISYLKGKAGELLKQLDETMKKVAKTEQEMNEVAKQYQKLAKETAAYQEQLKVSKVEYEKFKQPIEPEMRAIDANLKKLAKDIPADVMAKYADKRKDKRFPIVYVIGEKETHCGACGTELSMKQLDLLKKDDALVECENCRYLLYRDKK